MGANIHINVEPDAIVILRMDLPGKSVNTCTPDFLADLTEAVSNIERDNPPGVIITSSKAKSFNTGADLFELRKMNRDQMRAYLAMGQSLFERIAHLPMPTIAAINGDCLGGGCELALACRYRIAADNYAISIGLPEVKLGLIPAWSGTTRLPRIIGLARALPILLMGKTMPPRHALRAGMLDEIVRSEALIAGAKRILREQPAPHHPSRFDRMAVHVPAIRHRVLRAARRRAETQTRGNYPAPARLLDVVETGFSRGFAAGLDAERQAILDVAESEAGKNLLRLFFLRQSAKSQASAAVTAMPRPIANAAVIGGGTMGAGIIHALIRASIPVRLVEVDPPAISAALVRIKKLLNADISAGCLDKLAARHAFNRVSPTTDWTGLELADIVIEAVVETLPAKRDVFSRLDRLTRPAAVLATNTSSLRVSEIAQAALHPERVVGLHFFNPVEKMPLVEIARAAHSDDTSIATAIALCSRIGKTPIVVNDAPGFLVNRILVPYLAEALVLAAEGNSIRLVDETMKDWGMPMGPFELLDEIGLDIAAHVLDFLVDSATPPEIRAMMSRVIQAAMDQKFLGKKSGSGFYIYPPIKRRRKTKPAVNQSLISIITTGLEPAHPQTPTPEEIQQRLIFPMINQAARTLAEHVIDSTDAIDLATVLGLGLAPFRGGLIQYALSVGTAQLTRQMNDLAAKFGARFKPEPLFQELVSGDRLAASIDKSAPNKPEGAESITMTMARRDMQIH